MRDFRHVPRYTSNKAQLASGYGVWDAALSCYIKRTRTRRDADAFAAEMEATRPPEGELVERPARGYEIDRRPKRALW